MVKLHMTWLGKMCKIISRLFIFSLLLRLDKKNNYCFLSVFYNACFFGGSKMIISEIRLNPADDFWCSCPLQQPTSCTAPSAPQAVVPWSPESWADQNQMKPVNLKLVVCGLWYGHTGPGACQPNTETRFLWAWGYTVQAQCRVGWGSLKPSLIHKWTERKSHDLIRIHRYRWRARETVMCDL